MAATSDTGVFATLADDMLFTVHRTAMEAVVAAEEQGLRVGFLEWGSSTVQLGSCCARCGIWVDGMVGAGVCPPCCRAITEPETDQGAT